MSDDHIPNAPTAPELFINVVLSSAEGFRVFLNFFFDEVRRPGAFNLTLYFYPVLECDLLR